MFFFFSFEERAFFFVSYVFLEDLCGMEHTRVCPKRRSDLLRGNVSYYSKVTPQALRKRPVYFPMHLAMFF
jgi:hypothetical protein